MESARARSRERAKGINATLIEVALVDCDMLTQLCRKYSTVPINRVYLTTKKKDKKQKRFLCLSVAIFSPHHFPSTNVEGNSPARVKESKTDN